MIGDSQCLSNSELFGSVSGRVKTTYSMTLATSVSILGIFDPRGMKEGRETTKNVDLSRKTVCFVQGRSSNCLGLDHILNFVKHLLIYCGVSYNNKGRL